jgi:hypothetical protein
LTPAATEGSHERASAVGHEAADVKGWGTARDGSAGLGLRRPGALERVHLLLEEWQHAGQGLADTKARMLRVLDQLQLTALASSNPGPPDGWWLRLKDRLVSRRGVTTASHWSLPERGSTR